MSRSVLIVGTGLGGLATGLRLASRGYRVTFVEKAPQPGGRLNQIRRDGFTFDVGPSFFSMPYEFEELVRDCGTRIPFEFVELDPLYTVHFAGSNRKFFLYKDIDRLSSQFEGIEPNFKHKFTAYLKKCEQLYNDTVDKAIKRNFNSVPGYLLSLVQVNPKHIPVLFSTFWQLTRQYFQSPEARQIVSLVSYFLGRTPFDTNGVYTLLSHIEFKHTGYYNVRGGMYGIVSGLVGELQKHNARFHYHVEITGHLGSNGALDALVDQHGQEWRADIFVINSDAALFRGTVFNRRAYSDRRLRRKSWTMGYLTFYVGLKTKLPQVEHHNYFLGTNYENYAKGVITSPGTLEKPYYYVNVLSKHNPSCAPPGCEALFFVCPAPNRLYMPSWADKQQIVNSILHDFSERIGQDITRDVVLEIAYTPEDWQNQFNLYQGSGLGLTHSMLQIGAFRPRNFDEQFRNTFYVGASTVPGAGLPMAIISSRLAAERVLDYCRG